MLSTRAVARRSLIDSATDACIFITGVRINVLCLRAWDLAAKAENLRMHSDMLATDPAPAEELMVSGRSVAC